MTMEQKNPGTMSEHEKKNEGGREFGHVHEPTQAQQASRNQGLAGNQPTDGQRQPQTGQHQGTSQPQKSSSSSRQGMNPQQSKPPGNPEREQKKMHQSERKSA
jgi:hypothetical protein